MVELRVSGYFLPHQRVRVRASFNMTHAPEDDDIVLFTYQPRGDKYTGLRINPFGFSHIVTSQFRD